MASSGTVPLIVLAGSDRKPGELPPAGVGQHALSGYKGVDVRLDGQPLLALLVERLRAHPLFDPIVIAGPARVYAPALPGVRIVDTDASVGQNVRVALEAVSRGGPVAFTACDLLPDQEELNAVLEDYARQRPCDLWFPLIRAPRDPASLDVSAWKPAYRIRLASDAAPVAVLPSHLIIADPPALRLRFVYRLLEIAYHTRNRPIETRRRAFVVRVLGSLLYEDLLHLLVLRAPTLTWSVLSNGLHIARRLKRSGVQRTDLERAVASIVLKARHRRRHPERGVRLPVLEGLSLARDIDTEEEWKALVERARR